jgi:hypothetical protein
MNRRLKAFRIDFLNSTGGALSTGNIVQVNNANYTIVHENPQGNPPYSQSLNGFLSPYKQQARVRFRYEFNRVLGSEVTNTRNIFNAITQHHNGNNTIRLFYNYDDGTATSTADFTNVVVETPMEMVQRYSGQYGTFAPTLSFISQELITGTLPSGLNGI